MKLLYKTVAVLLVLALILPSAFAAEAVIPEGFTVTDDMLPPAVRAVGGLKMGDVNLDGKVNNADLVLLARFVVGFAEFTLVQLSAGDINGDRKIDNSDLIGLAKYLIRM